MRNRRFVIDGYFLAEKRPVGLHRFSTEIVRELDAGLDCSNIEIAVPSKEDIHVQFKNLKIVEVAPWLMKKGKSGMKIWQKVAYPLYVARVNGVSVDLAFAQQLFKCDICAVFDCITLKYPRNFPGAKEKIARKLNAYRIIKSARKAKKVITLSNDAKKDIIKYIGIPEDKIVVISCAWQHINNIGYDDEILSKLPQGFDKENYFFALGSRYFHKNIKWIIKSAKQNANECFVITGTNFQKSSDMEDDIPDNVFFTGYLSDEEIKSLMKYCKAFIQPSFYEGFGIPPLEALSEGSQIIVAKASCLPEIYGDTAHYIDPYNYENIDLKRIMASNVCNARVALEKYSWKKSAETFYNMLMNDL
ncbi:glycosyltransferase family 1 protein [Desulfosporosinus sp. Sb-LF]|uniref:glycosyltransferase family 4 protein n=1 Tax=Desulfosporosinus sp. Sb-LF TaxID=2560027 RepID=UPI00107F2E0A|nr:glycosyltransferase family 1 protein [Desulfosporosinus sp. Sb-LF]TGE31899.1 glycosyltransferase family 1 protein [Desulfosporosinus sp. Sb-LF]